ARPRKKETRAVAYRAAVAPRQKAASFDHVIRGRKQRRRDVDAKRLRRLAIEHHLELGRLLHRKVGRLFALEHAPYRGREKPLTKVRKRRAFRPNFGLPRPDPCLNYLP